MDNFPLECFVSVCQTTSFTKSAHNLKRTQSAITQQIANLERRLGVKLFVRTKHIQLTKEAEVFLPYALEILRLQREVEDKLRAPEISGAVHVGVPEDFATVFLADLLIDFSHIHPLVGMDVECDLSLNLLEKFHKELLDLVIVKVGKGDLPSEKTKLWQEPLVFVGRHLPNLKEGQPLPLVLSPEPCVYRRQALYALETNKIPYKIVYSSPSFAGLTAAVKASMGLTVLPVTMVTAPLQRVIHPILPPLPDIHVHLLRRSSSSIALSHLSQFLLERLALHGKTRESLLHPPNYK